MMIATIATAPPPAREAGTAPAEGFEQAMAAALGLAPVPAGAPAHAPDPAPVPNPAFPSGRIPGSKVSSTAGTLGVVVAGPAGQAPADATGPTDTTDGTPVASPAQMEHPRTDATGPSPLPLPPETTDPNQAGSPTHPVDVSGSKPELPNDPGNRMFAPDPTEARTQGLALVGEVVPPVANPTGGSGAGQDRPPAIDRAVIAAQGLGLRTLRSDGDASSRAGTGAQRTSLELIEPIAVTPESASTPDPTKAPGGAIDVDPASIRSQTVHEHAAPGADVSTEARTAATERTGRILPGNGEQARSDRLPLDAPTPTGDAVVAPTTTSGNEVPGAGRVPSGLAQRVEDAVRRLENAPPPRSITLSIDDQGLTRVTVSVLSDGVRLTVPEGSQTPLGLVNDLERALSSRGFDLSGGGEHRERRTPDETTADTPRPPTPQPRRAGDAADAGVRL